MLAGRYRVQRLLGRGGMGAVYLADDEVLHELVALKVISSSFSSDEAALVARFRREASAARKVSSPNVIRIHDLGEARPGLLYLSMEYFNGRTLNEVIAQRGVVPMKDVQDILQQVCNGLEAAHEAGVIHRDLKPGNVLVGERGAVKLIDFGLATTLVGDNLTATGAILGTPHYMAPEQVRGKPVDARADIYSLGALAYHLVTGRPPFTGENAIAVGFAHCSETPDAPRTLRRDCPPALDAAILAALAKNPADRPGDAESVLRAGVRGERCLIRAMSLALAIGACGDNIRPIPADATELPDLAVVPGQMTGTEAITTASFDGSSCEVVEGCVDAVGERRLLSFATVTENRGTADLNLGPVPPPGVSSGIFVWSPCHMHHHVMGYANFDLLDASGDVVDHRPKASVLSRGRRADRAGTALAVHVHAAGHHGRLGRHLRTRSGVRVDRCHRCALRDLHGARVDRPDAMFPDADRSNNVWVDTVVALIRSMGCGGRDTPHYRAAACGRFGFDDRPFSSRIRQPGRAGARDLAIGCAGSRKSGARVRVADSILDRHGSTGFASMPRATGSARSTSMARRCCGVGRSSVANAGHTRRARTTFRSASGYQRDQIGGVAIGDQFVLAGGNGSPATGTTLYASIRRSTASARRAHVPARPADRCRWP